MAAACVTFITQVCTYDEVHTGYLMAVRMLADDDVRFYCLSALAELF